VTIAATTLARDDELQLVRALRDGSEKAFASLLERYHTSLLHFARSIVRDRETAEDVVQETWLGVVRGLDKFRGDSTLKTWIFRIMINTARTRAVRDCRSAPLAALGNDLEEGSVDVDRFLADGHWASTPTSWDTIPEERLLAGETLRRIQDVIATLPTAQRQVITLRDVGGWPAEEVCALLGLSEANQRVLLHRARAKVRATLETYFDEVA
jgi:RNA polymerase sigma-70 factor (ECF subfamily)